MSKYHKTKDGKRTLISKLETSHLINIINLIQRNVEDKVANPKLVAYSDGWGGPADCDYEYFNEYELLEKYNYSEYVKELMKRV